MVSTWTPLHYVLPSQIHGRHTIRPEQESPPASTLVIVRPRAFLKSALLLFNFLFSNCFPTWHLPVRSPSTLHLSETALREGRREESLSRTQRGWKRQTFWEAFFPTVFYSFPFFRNGDSALQLYLCWSRVWVIFERCVYEDICCFSF